MHSSQWDDCKVSRCHVLVIHDAVMPEIHSVAVPQLICVIPLRRYDTPRMAEVMDIVAAAHFMRRRICMATCLTY